MIAAGGRALRVAGLFAGIGGIELGLSAAGHEPVLLAELLPEARAVLAAHMDAPVVPDVREIADLPAEVDLLTAGFPCQDLSSVGRKGGISGTKSKLVGEVFRLLERRPVDWVVMENVPFLLHLDKGK
ncbi:MAG: DNA cytosine methyltransferase, partial [Actinomycetota bacterium]